MNKHGNSKEKPVDNAVYYKAREKFWSCVCALCVVNHNTHHENECSNFINIETAVDETVAEE
jgi:hypothetical protein